MSRACINYIKITHPFQECLNISKRISCKDKVYYHYLHVVFYRFCFLPKSPRPTLPSSVNSPRDTCYISLENRIADAPDTSYDKISDCKMEENARVLSQRNWTLLRSVGITNFWAVTNATLTYLKKPRPTTAMVLLSSSVISGSYPE